MPLDWDVEPGSDCGNRWRCTHFQQTRAHGAWGRDQLVREVCPTCQKRPPIIPDYDATTIAAELADMIAYHNGNRFWLDRGTIIAWQRALCAEPVSAKGEG